MPTEAPEVSTPEEQHFAAGVTQISKKFSGLMKEVEAQEAKPPAGSPPPERPAAAAATPPPAENPTENPAEPAKPAEALTDEPPANLSPKAGESWKAFRTKANTAIADKDKEIIQLRSTISELEKKTAAPIGDPAELTNLRTERDNYEKQLQVLAIERHPKFKAAFDDKIAAGIENAKKLVGGELGVKVEKLLRNPDSEYRSEQLEAIAAELPPLKQAQLGSMLLAIQNIQGEREAELAKASEHYKTLTQAQQREKETSESTENQKREQFTKAALEICKGLEAFKTKDGDEAHNKTVRERENLVRAFTEGKLGVKAMAWMAPLAEEATYLKETRIPELEGEVTRLNGIIAKLSNSTPPVVPGGDGGAAKPNHQKSFLEVYKANAPQGQ